MAKFENLDDPTPDNETTGSESMNMNPGAGQTPPPPPTGNASEPAGPADPEQRTMGMLCHLLAFVGFVGVPLGNIIGPLVIWLIKKDTMPFVDDQGKESLNFQITATIAGIVLGVFSIIPFVFCITLPLLLALLIYVIVYVIMATLKANEGIAFRYPIRIEFFK